MPSFEPQEDDFKLIIAFKTEELREEFISKHSIKMTSKTKTLGVQEFHSRKEVIGLKKYSNKESKYYEKNNIQFT